MFSLFLAFNLIEFATIIGSIVSCVTLFFVIFDKVISRPRIHFSFSDLKSLRPYTTPQNFSFTFTLFYKNSGINPVQIYDITFCCSGKDSTATVFTGYQQTEYFCKPKTAEKIYLSFSFHSLPASCVAAITMRTSIGTYKSIITRSSEHTKFSALKKIKKFERL